MSRRSPPACCGGGSGKNDRLFLPGRPATIHMSAVERPAIAKIIAARTSHVASFRPPASANLVIVHGSVEHVHEAASPVPVDPSPPAFGQDSPIPASAPAEKRHAESQAAAAQLIAEACARFSTSEGGSSDSRVLPNRRGASECRGNGRCGKSLTSAEERPQASRRIRQGGSFCRHRGSAGGHR